MTFEFLQTERMKLRILNPESYNYIFRNFKTAELKEFLGIRTEHEWEREIIKFEKGLTTFNRSFLLFQLITLSDNRVIGACGFHNWLAEHSRSEIGYKLSEEDDKQKGYMSEALKYIIPYGFHQLNLNRIEAFIHEDNIASLKLINKFNFQKEGLLREHFCKDGIIEDSTVYSLLRKDFSSSQ